MEGMGKGRARPVVLRSFDRLRIRTSGGSLGKEHPLVLRLAQSKRELLVRVGKAPVRLRSPFDRLRVSGRGLVWVSGKGCGLGERKRQAAGKREIEPRRPHPVKIRQSARPEPVEGQEAGCDARPSILRRAQDSG